MVIDKHKGGLYSTEKFIMVNAYDEKVWSTLG